jgi:hypothetical protein
MGFQTIKVFNAAAEGNLRVAVSVCIIVATFAALVAAALTGIDLVEW